MSKIAWSQFTSGGAIKANDQTVGLRSGNNYRFTANTYEILNVDNLTFDGNTISSTDVNGNIQLVPNGIVTISKDMTVNSVTVGQGLTSGLTNTAVGESALLSTSSGTQCVAVGYKALESHTSGGTQTAVGYRALTAATTSAACTAIGYSAFTAVTTAINGLAVGGGAGISLTTGNGNTFVGKSAGSSIGAVAGTTTGGNNTFVGFGAGCASATGSSNIAIGVAANASASTGTTSATNGPGIAIGSTSAVVGFRGDATPFPTAGASAGYWRVKINGTHYKIEIFADS